MARSPNISQVPHPVFMFPETAIKRRVDALGGEAFFGRLARKDLKVAWYFEKGCVCYNSDMMQAFEVHGEIFIKWTQLGGLAWGTPTTDEVGTKNNVGRCNHFNGGTASIYFVPGSGAWPIFGAIREKWIELGGELSALGYPVTDELLTPDTIGRFNHFQNDSSIYWNPKTGAAQVGGDIRRRWAALGWERSYLGYPTSDEVDFADGGRANSFQNGGVYWWGDSGAIDLRGVIVSFVGFHCFGETDNDQLSGSDEIYLPFAVVTPRTATVTQSRVHTGVDKGGTYFETVELYKGDPYGINIGTVVMEQDFGDPNKYKQQIIDLVMATHKAGTVALGLIPIVGPVIAAVIGPALGLLMPALGGAISNFLGFGDDRVGSAQGHAVLP